MKLPIFKLEEYLGEREFSTEIMLSGSDMETFLMHELISMADNNSKELWNSLKLSYTTPTGHPLLLHEINKKYNLKNSLHNICTFAGAEEGIYSLFTTLLNKDDHAIIVTPCYQSLLEIPKSIADVSEVNLKFMNGNCVLDINEIEKKIKPNTKVLVINFPHNPSGALITQEEQKYLVELARKNDFYIFSDEVYRGLEHNPENRLPPIASIYEKGISLGVMSKLYGLAGLRIGWLACQNQAVLKEVEKLKCYLSICNSAPSEILAIIALQNENKIYERNFNILKSNLKIAKEFFNINSKYFEWFEPKGGCVAFPKLLLKQSIFDFAEEFRKAEGVLITPGCLFNNDSNHFRIGYGRLNFIEGIQRLQNFCNKKALK